MRNKKKIVLVGVLILLVGAGAWVWLWPAGGVPRGGDPDPVAAHADAIQQSILKSAKQEPIPDTATRTGGRGPQKAR